jgi:sedoheptulokinase
MNIIGLDIGTTSICGVLYSKDTNKSLKVSTCNNQFIKSLPGEYQQDADDIYSKVQSIVDELIEFSNETISAMSLSSQMHGILYVNKEGKAVTPFYTWQNQRGLKEVDNIKLENILSKKLQYPVYSGYGIVTHYSLFKEKSIPSSASSFCTIGDYVCMRLANKKSPLTDITLAHSMGICDIATGKKAEGLKTLGDECLNYLPEISSSITVLGEYKSISVVQPLGDNQASFLGSVKEKDKSLLLNYGTAGQISLFNRLNEIYPGFETRSLGPNEGYIHAAFSLCGGNSYKILANFYESIASLVVKDTDFNFMEIMNKMDFDFSKEDIKCMPYFLGQRGKIGSTASFTNISEANFTPENMVKSLIVGMVNELYENYENIPHDARNRIKVLIGAGNGIRKNKHLQKAIELTYGKPIELLTLSEESCLGAIIHAGTAMGIYKDYSEGSFEIVNYN